jgi:hypothetical protein
LRKAIVFQDLDRRVRPPEVSLIPEEMRVGLVEMHNNLVEIVRKLTAVLDRIDSEERIAQRRAKQIERQK